MWKISADASVIQSYKMKQSDTEWYISAEVIGLEWERLYTHYVSVNEGNPSGEQNYRAAAVMQCLF